MSARAGSGKKRAENAQFPSMTTITVRLSDDHIRELERRAQKLSKARGQRIAPRTLARELILKGLQGEAA